MLHEQRYLRTSPLPVSLSPSEEPESRRSACQHAQVRALEETLIFFQNFAHGSVAPQLLLQMLMDNNLHHFDNQFHDRRNRNFPDLLSIPFRHNLLPNSLCNLHLWDLPYFTSDMGC